MVLLNVSRSKLQRLEDTICLSLFERMQYKLDIAIYEKGIKLVLSQPIGTSFFEYLFRKLEVAYDLAGRYAHPEERPFFITPSTPSPPCRDDVGIKPVTNLNDRILSAYMEWLPKICPEGDDNQRGSPATADINVLQALSRRVHIGEQVAEAKSRDDIAVYDALIRGGDREGLVQKLRAPAMEAGNIERIRRKAERYQVPAEIVGAFFVGVVMPLTIEAEVQYFLAKQPVTLSR